MPAGSTEEAALQVRRGVSRTVLLVGRWAVKVPRLHAAGRNMLWAFTAGAQANLSEREWSCLDTVCPVVWSLGGLVNVYRRATPVAALGDDAYPPLEIGGVALTVDRKPGNVGLLDGRLVWLDYDQSQGECHACRRYRASSAAN